MNTYVYNVDVINFYCSNSVMKLELHGNSSSMDVNREKLFDNEARNET